MCGVTAYLVASPDPTFTPQSLRCAPGGTKGLTPRNPSRDAVAPSGGEPSSQVRFPREALGGFVSPEELRNRVALVVTDPAKPATRAKT